MTTSAAADGLLARRIVFVGGKGGVGKTTTAAALALAAAEHGRTCLVVSTDPAHSLGDIVGRSIGDAETALAPNLTGLEIDPDRAAAAHIGTVKERMKTLVHPRLYDEIDRQLDLAAHAPGATEAALIERVAELMALAGSRFDLVVFDTAPSGHTVRLLSLPEVMGAWMDGLLRHRERSSRLGAMLGHLGGKPGHGDDLSLIETHGRIIPATVPRPASTRCCRHGGASSSSPANACSTPPAPRSCSWSTRIACRFWRAAGWSTR